MTLKEELIQYYQEQEADYDPEETKIVLEILSEYDDELTGLNNTDKTLLLRLISDDELYEKVDAIEIPEINEEDIFG